MLFVIDLETTGLSPQDAAIVELAAVAVQDGGITGRFETLVWPGREYLQAGNRQVLTKVSGINPIALLSLDVPDVPVARRRFLEWLYQHAGAVVPRSHEEWSELRVGQPERTPIRITSYNLEFEQRFLEGSPWSLEYHLSANAKAKVIWAPCVMQAAAARLGEARGRIRLPLACERLGVPFSETHRALQDAEAAAALAVRLGLENERVEL